MLPALLTLAALAGTQAHSVPPLAARKIGGGFNVPYQDIAVRRQEAKVRVSEPLLSGAKEEEALVAIEEAVPESSVASAADAGVAVAADTDFVGVFRHLFEILQDVLDVMRLLQEGGQEDAWPALKEVFLRYLDLLHEAPLLAELRQVLPVAQLREALVKDDAELLTRAVVQSLNPSLAVYVFRTVRAMVRPVVEAASTLPSPAMPDVAELRQYIPDPPSLLDLTYPLRYAVHRGIAAFQNIFQARWLGPFGGRAFDDTEEEYSSNALEERSDSSVLSGSLVMGVGSSLLVTVVAYNWLTSSATETAVAHNRVRRDLHSSLMPGDDNLPHLIQVLEAVEAEHGDQLFEAEETELDAAAQDSGSKPVKNDVPKKFDPLQKLVNFASKHGA